MNCKSFYLEIGNIDDELIQEANEANGYHVHKFNVVRLVGIAACLFLICSAILFCTRRDIVYYNENPASPALKTLVPSGENDTVLMLTCEEFFNYYGLHPFPDVISGLQKSTQTQYPVYQSSENTAYDISILAYHSDDEKQTLSIIITKDASNTIIQEENSSKKSRIHGIPLVLTVSENAVQPVYEAKIQNQDVLVRIISSDMNEDDFTSFIREFIAYQK